MTNHTINTVQSDAKPAYIYARFSTMEQAKGHSLERQIMLGKAFVEQNGWRLEETFNDEGKSAFHGANREDGSTLFAFEKRASEGDFKQGAVLVVENIDRLSRQGAKAAARLIWMFNENGVDVATFQDGHVYKSGDDADLMDLFSIIVKAQLAYEESLKKSKRIKAVWDAKHRAVLAGDKNPISRKAPEWICIRDGQYALVDHRVEILNEIFDDYISGLGEHYIVKKLNDRKEENWGRGNGWHRSYIHKCLVNRRVLGEYIIHPRHDVARRGEVLHSSYYPQAITAEKFNKAQLVRGGRQRTGGAIQSAASNLFSGIAKCDECGGTMAYLAKGKDKRRPNSVATSYMQCDNARRHHQCTNRATLRYDRVERAVLDQLLWATIEKGLENPKASQLQGEIAELNRKIVIIEKQIANIVNSISDTPSKALAMRANELEIELEELQSKRTDVSKQHDKECAKPSSQDDVELLHALKDNLEDVDSDARMRARMTTNTALKRIIRAMRMSADGTFYVYAEDMAVWMFDADGNVVGGQAL